jgi:uncharacterized protein
MPTVDSLEQNRQAALAFVDALATNRLEEIAGLFDGQAMFWSLTDRTPYSFDEYVALYHRLITTRFVDGIRIQTGSVVAEGDLVVVQCESHGDIANGKHYNNMYLFLVQVSGGLIRNVREYCDTHHSWTVLRAE